METVVIIGSGIIGKSWAMLFASQGHQVRLYDTIPAILEKAPEFINSQLKDLETKGLLLGGDKYNAAKQASLISVYTDLHKALTGATYIQECTPEGLQIKIDIFKILDTALNKVGNTKAIVASSTSTLMSTQFTEGLSIKNRTVVVHPVNPPYFVKLVEIVPNPTTKPEVTAHTKDLINSLGRKSIVMNKELPGFALNRVQYVILNETWRLIADGVLSVEDADLVMKEGLAPRYIFMGPMETAQLNADGFLDYCRRYNPTIYGVSESMGPTPKFLPDSATAKEIDRQLQQHVPDSTLPQRRLWRDNNLAMLSSFKDQNNIGK